MVIGDIWALVVPPGSVLVKLVVTLSIVPGSCGFIPYNVLLCVGRWLETKVLVKIMHLLACIIFLTNMEQQVGVETT